jgi:hypothetical protein
MTNPAAVTCDPYVFWCSHIEPLNFPMGYSNKSDAYTGQPLPGQPPTGTELGAPIAEHEATGGKQRVIWIPPYDGHFVCSDAYTGEVLLSYPLTGMGLGTAIAKYDTARGQSQFFVAHTQRWSNYGDGPGRIVMYSNGPPNPGMVVPEFYITVEPQLDFSDPTGTVRTVDLFCNQGGVGMDYCLELDTVSANWVTFVDSTSHGFVSPGQCAEITLAFDVPDMSVGDNFVYIWIAGNDHDYNEMPLPENECSAEGYVVHDVVTFNAYVAPDTSIPCDPDGSGFIDIDDPVYLINYIFLGGPPPDPLEAGDCTDPPDGIVDVDDVVYLIAYIFSGGPAPCEDRDGMTPGRTSELPDRL